MASRYPVEEGHALTDKDILAISRTVPYDHISDLGVQLNFTLVEIQNLKKQYRDDTKDIVTHMLQQWKMKTHPRDCTVEAVTKMLGDVKYVIEVPNRKDAMITTRLSVEKCRERLIGNYQKTCKIALKPWDKTDYVDCKDLHTRISLVVKGSGERDGEEARKVPLPGSIDDIFKTEVDGSLPSRILMVGGAGHGKTTALSKIALDWANGAEGSPLKNVPLLFALKFRRSDKHTSLGEAIVKQLLGKMEGITPEDMEKFIEENEEDVVILLDGYDEYSGSIASEGPKSSLEELLLYQRFQNCRVLVTCRPHRKDHFEIDDLSFVYARIDIEGFSREDSDHYIDQFFASTEPNAKGIKNYIQSHPAIGSLINIPFFCMSLCVLWQGGFLQDTESLTALLNRLLKYLLEHARSKSSIGSKNVVGKQSKGLIKSVMTRIGEVALNSLFENNKKLLFDEDDFCDCQEELEIAVAIGLLSKQAVVEETSEWDEGETVFVEFYHKLAQEHCAGFYLSTLSSDALEDILEDINNEERALEMENVLKFASGSSEKACLTILKRFETIEWITPSKQLQTIGIRSEYHRFVFDILCESTGTLSEELLTKTILPCFKDDEFHFVETSSSGTVYGFTRLPSNVKTKIKSLVIAYCELTSNHWDLLWRSLALCKSLRRLDLKGCTLDFNNSPEVLPSVRQLDMMGITTDHRLMLASLPNLEEIRISGEFRTRSDAFMREIVDGILKTGGRQSVVSLVPMSGYSSFRRSTCASAETVDFFVKHTLPHMMSLTVLTLEVPMEYDDVINIIKGCLLTPTIYKLSFFLDVPNPLDSDGTDHPDNDLKSSGSYVVERKSWQREFAWKEHFNDNVLTEDNVGDTCIWVYIVANFKYMAFKLQRAVQRENKDSEDH